MDCSVPDLLHRSNTNGARNTAIPRPRPRHLSCTDKHLMLTRGLLAPVLRTSCRRHLSLTPMPPRRSVRWELVLGGAIVVGTAAVFAWRYTWAVNPRALPAEALPPFVRGIHYKQESERLDAALSMGLAVPAVSTAPRSGTTPDANSSGRGDAPSVVATLTASTSTSAPATMDSVVRPPIDGIPCFSLVESHFIVVVFFMCWFARFPPGPCCTRHVRGCRGGVGSVCTGHERRCTSCRRFGLHR
jgi:hypothetical protein